jgi:hypothetical protein
MNKKLFLLGCSLAFSGLLSSCYTAPYGGYSDGGDFPRNGAEALVPIVVGAALIAAIASNNSHHGGYYGGHYSHHNDCDYGY